MSLYRINSKALASAAAICALGVGGCSDTAEPSGTNAGSGGGGSVVETRVLRVASSWASAGDQEALQVLLTAFQDQTGARVEVVALAQDPTGRTAQYQTSDWDVGQENYFNLSESFTDDQGGYTALDLASEDDLDESLARVFPEVKDLLTVEGQVIGFPMNLHRENTLIYSKASMPTPPRDIFELRQVCDDYVAGGRVGPKPLAIAQADWLYRILFEALLPGPVLAATSANPMPEFTAAAEVIAHYIDESCLWVAPTEQGWTEAAHALIDGEAMMYIHGDWAKGYLVQLGWTPGVDFDVAPAPGSDGAFYYGVDVFGVNKSSPRRDLAIQFAKIAMTNVVQAAFSARKGSTPGVIFDNPGRDFTDASLRATYAELALGMQNGGAMPVQPWMGLQGNALVVPLRDGSKTPGEVAADFLAVYPTAP